jgi:hypothetical protein
VLRTLWRTAASARRARHWWFDLPQWVSETLQLTPQQLQSLYLGCEVELQSSPMAALGR